jgi:hypothetical protein
MTAAIEPNADSQGSSRPQRLLPFAFICAGLMVAAALILTVWWLSPSYSLRQIASAIDNRDTQELKKYADVDQLSAQIIDEASIDTNGLAFVVVQNMRLALITRLSSTMLQAVESGNVRDRNFGGIPGTMHVVRIEKSTRYGKVADVDLIVTFPPQNNEEILKLQMRDKATHWQLFRISNLREIATLQRARAEAAALAAEGAILEAQRRQPTSTSTIARPQFGSGPSSVPSATETRLVKKVVGYAKHDYTVPGYVAFDRANRDFHIFGCKSVTLEMEKVNVRTLEVQNVPRNPDCANLPLPYETRTVEEPIYETTTEAVQRPPAFLR